MRENVDQCVSAAARDTRPTTRVKSWARNLGSLEATTHGKDNHVGHMPEDSLSIALIHKQAFMTEENSVTSGDIL
jgi:hypothetical protein